MKFTSTILLGLMLLATIIIGCNDSTEPDDNNNNNNNNGDAPVISTLSKTETYSGYPLEITGDKFGFEKGNSSVLINGVNVTKFIRWSFNSIKVMIPENATTGKVIVKVGDKTSNEVNLKILSPATTDAPVIKAFDNAKPFVRATVGIEGSNFGDPQGESFVTINGVLVDTYTSWKDKKIVILIPTGATSGNLIVYVKGNASNSKLLELQTENYLLKQVLIPAGTFMMGADNEDLAFNSPVHEVTISKPFYMSIYEITQGNWESVKLTLGFGHNSYNEGPDNPVERVSWIDACKFCNALSKMERFTQVYTITGEDVSVNWNANGYRLPTEAEWELAARAGSTYKYGKGADGENANVHRIGWHNENCQSTMEVGQKDANAFGLYDIIGNVREWCWDWFDADYYEAVGEKITDPKGPDNSDGTKVLRGGCYVDDRLNTTVSYRWSYGYEIQSEYYIGFRVVRNAW